MTATAHKNATQTVIAPAHERMNTCQTTKSIQFAGQ